MKEIAQAQPQGEALPTLQSMAWAALQQYQRAEMWTGIAAERLQLLARMGIRSRELEDRNRRLIAFLLLAITLSAVEGLALFGLLFGFFKWGMR